MSTVTVDLGKLKFNWRGAYNSGTTYKKDDVVEHGGSSWVCVATSISQSDPSGSNSNWDLMAQGGDPASIMTTQGDLLVRGATGLESVPIGSAGDLVKVNTAGTGLEYGTVSTGSHTLLQRYTEVDEQPGTWAVPHSFGWVPHLYANFTPQSANSRIRWQVHFSADSRDTGSISTGAMAISNTDGSSVQDLYYVNNSGHSYYYGHTQHHIYEMDSWGTTAKRVGFRMGKHGSGYNIYAHRKTWGSPSDPGGTTDANDDRSAFLLIEEWIEN